MKTSCPGIGKLLVELNYMETSCLNDFLFCKLSGNFTLTNFLLIVLSEYLLVKKLKQCI